MAWGSVDFKFRNDTGKSCMIRSWVEGGALTVGAGGEDGAHGRRYTTSAFYDIRKPAHGKSNPRVIYDADLGPGRDPLGEGHRRAERQGRAHGEATRTARCCSATRSCRATQPMDWVKRVGT